MSTISQPRPVDDPTKVVTVLALMGAEENRARLREIFTHTRWKLHEAANCKAAFARLERIRFPVVLCECDLADGNWREILDQPGEMPDPPLVIVASRCAR